MGQNLPPKYVLHILNTLENAGFEARAVGGCVRDTLLSRRPSDWDVATAAPPEAVAGLFRRTLPTGVRHGTVTVLYGGAHCEVTTYRSDGGYSDHRRPDSVRFTTRLEEDLSRRDFTVNAMAMDSAGRVTDPFGGRDDLARGLLRCVRFAAKLGFGIDGPTLAAALECAPLTAALSAERVADEIMGILASPRPDYVRALTEWGLLSGRVLEGRAAAPRRSLAALPRYARLAHWCAELERDGYIMSTEEFLRSLRLDRRTIRTAAGAARILLSGNHDYKRLLRDFGPDAVRAAFPGSAGLRAVLSSGECWCLSSLAVGGEELRALGYSGRELGEALARLLEHVIDRPQDNKREVLCELAKERKL